MIEFGIDTLIDKVGFTDPASGKIASNKTQRAQTAHIVGGQDRDGKAFVFEALGHTVATDQIVQTLFQLNRKYGCARWGIESSAQQNLFVDSTIREAVTRREPIRIVPVEQPTSATKEFRITSIVQHWLHNGFLYVAEDLEDLRRQIERYPNVKTCDIVDALASFLVMLRDPFASKHGLAYDQQYKENLNRVLNQNDTVAFNNRFR